MDNKEMPLDIYLMGIGGTGMGAFAGLLKQSGHRVFGSDSAVYSPMKEKLADWGIKYRTPYDAKNLPASCDLVIVGNVIRRENPEALEVVAKKLAFDSFPGALNKLFLRDAIPVVASGTHGKTTCSALLAHTFHQAETEPGFIVGGIPLNFGESFRASPKRGAPFVVEGDEYDTAYFDKRPKFIHYDPQFLLVTSLEFDHADIYRDLNAVIEAFSSLMKTLSPERTLVINGDEQNIQSAIKDSACRAKIVTYGATGDYRTEFEKFERDGIYCSVVYRNQNLGSLFVPLFGRHNLKNALGCYAVLHSYGLTHEQIAFGFKTFAGVKRRLEERSVIGSSIVVDDFAHHPTAVFETIKAARQKYPDHKICAIFEPRSATTCMKIFEERYEAAFQEADRVLLAPVGRNLPEDSRLDTAKIASSLIMNGVKAKAFSSYTDLGNELKAMESGNVLLFMSNGDFQGMLKDVENILA